MALTSPFPVIQAARRAPISSRALTLRACRHGIAVFMPLTPGAVALGRRPSRTSCHPAPTPTSPRARSRAKRVLREKHSELSLREAYGGRRAHCRPPLLCAGPARQFGGAKPLPGSGVLRASETQGRHWKAGHKARGVKHASPPGPRRPQFVAATARRSRRANRPLSRLSGVGGHPGMVRSTGMTEATGPTQA